MTDATPGTEITVNRKPTLPPAALAAIEERKLRNAVTQQIRGTIWGKDLTEHTVRAIAEYARAAGIDAVRHVEILGGRIYLTADFYAERGAALIRQGIVRPDEPDVISADPRLVELAAGAGPNAEWARAEGERRLRERITHGVPEGVRAAVVQRFHVRDGATVIGVNWCGNAGRKDPVGDAEPTKTAITRAARRAWRQLAEVVPAYAEAVRPIESAANAVEVVECIPPAPLTPHALARVSPEDPYARAEAPLADDLPPELQEDPLEAANASAAADFVCPFGHDGVKGRRLGDIETATLEKSVAWARENAPTRFRAFLEHAGTVLADREAAVGQEEMEL